MNLILNTSNDLETCCSNPKYFFTNDSYEVVCINCASVVGKYYPLEEKMKEKDIKHYEIFMKKSTTFNQNQISKLSSKYIDYKKWKKLSKINFKLEHGVSYCFSYFNLLVNTYNDDVPENVKLDAKKLINKSLDNRISRGKTLESMVESSILMAYEINGINQGLRQFFKKFQMYYCRKKLKEIRSFIDYYSKNFIKKGDSLNANPKEDAKKYLLKMCAEFSISEQTKISLLKAVDSNIFNLAIFQGKSMPCVAAGLFYYQCRKNNNPSVSMKKISNYSGYSEISIRSRFKEFCRIKLNAELTKCKKPSVELSKKAFMTDNSETILNNLELMLTEYPKIKDKITQLINFYSVP
ncbi:MAG: hypothetical protein WC376_05275 [Candidatus Nanoarchaeia archaeon]|jgi:transcription initiation factor TFIIIB Brf1 subunit/transcription initiation factor TFIIB